MADTFGKIILVSVIEEDVFSMFRRKVCEETGLSPDEVEVKIDPLGNLHAIARPKDKIECMMFQLSFDKEMQ